MTITEQYSQYCSSVTLDEVPDGVVDHTKKLVYDTVGIMVGAHRYAESSEPILESIRNVAGTESGDATVYATGESLPAEYAALVNGAFAHSLDYDDTHRRASLHPGSSVIASALATAESADASGESVLEGIIAGYEISCRLSKALNPPSPYERGFHPTGVVGVFGATAAAGTIRGLTVEEFEAAFGLNGSQASGSQQFLKNGAWNKRLHPGFAAHDALLSAEFAENGFVGSEAPIEGERAGLFVGYTDEPKPERTVESLGSEYEIANSAIKPYPCCRFMHPPMDLLVELSNRIDDTTRITDIEVELPAAGVDIVGRPRSQKKNPETFVDAQFSQPFGTALALRYDDTSVETFKSVADSELDSEFERLIDITTVQASDTLDEKYPNRWASRVTITTESRTYTESTDYAKGEPENPMGWDECEEKFESLTVALDTDTQTALRSIITDLENREMDELIAQIAR